MDAVRRRRYVLAGLLVLFSVLAGFVLREVLGTVFFAITVAYVLVPARNSLVRRGLSRRVASALVTTGAFTVVVSVGGAFGYLLYQRRQSVFELVESLPPTLGVEVAGMRFVVELSTVIETVTTALQAAAASLAPVVPVLALKLVLFTILLFGLLLRPGAAGEGFRRVVPDEYHDIFVALNERVRQTLYGIYVLQAATAFGTGLVALVVFFVLGYDSLFTLAILAGVLQFVPVLGPSLLVVVLAVVDLAAGNPTRAVLVLVAGGVLIGAVPDAVIRPRLASWAADLPTSLYFIGFVGGVLTVGAIGFIAGPLVVALVVEVVDLLADGRASTSPQTEGPGRPSTVGAAGAPGGETGGPPADGQDDAPGTESDGSPYDGPESPSRDDPETVGDDAGGPGDAESDGDSAATDR